MPKALELTGQIFGEWTIIRKGTSIPKLDASGKLKGTISRWVCRCSCGSEKEVITDSLRSGRSTNCGHVAQEKHYSNYKGERFGFLQVLDTYLPEKGMARARCVCACGNSTDTTIQALINGNTKSCGCIRKQSSQQRMKKMYDEHHMIKDDLHRIVSWQPKSKEKL